MSNTTSTMSHLDDLLAGHTDGTTPSSTYNDRTSSNTSQELQARSIEDSMTTLTPTRGNSGGEGRRRNRRRVACVECRQQKSKCDAFERAPLPCSKCDKKGVPCILKRDYRRTYKRARNEVIERRFKELTENLSRLSSEELIKHIEEDQMVLSDKNGVFTLKALSRDKKCQQSELGHANEQVPKASHDSNGKRTGSLSNTGQLPLPNVLYTDLSKEMTPTELKCGPKTLGEIYMSSEDIADLFQEFATKYHRFLPVVDLHKGAERIYSLSPCLFWVILLIGLRRRENNKNSIDLMTRLSSLVKAILSEIIISPILRYTPKDTDAPVINVTSVYSVQAFLLYTFWPPLVSSLSADSSWNTIATAMCQAIRIGLNNTYFSKEYVSENAELVSEQRRTWICCNIVSQFIASSFGFPAFVSFDNIVMNALRLDTPESLVVPPQLRQMIQIAFFENQIVSTMSPSLTDGVCSTCPSLSGEMEKLSLLNLLSQQLAQLEVGLSKVSHEGSVDRVDGIRKFLLLAAKVHLLTYYFFESDVQPCFDIKRGLVKAYNASIDLLTHAYEMFSQDNTIIKYFPGIFVINIWQTACIVGKLAHSSLRGMIDVDRGKAVYKNAVSLTSKASILRYDLAFRSSGIMRSIWHLFNGMYNEWIDGKQAGKIEGDEFNLNLTVRSRMSVSVFFDCLYLLRGKCGIARLRREKGINQPCEIANSKVNTGNSSCGDKCIDRTVESESCPTENLVEYPADADVDADVDGDTDVEGDGPMHCSDMSSKPLATKARHLIETIPLDPVPICADKVSSHIHSSSSRIATPDNLSGAVERHETLSNVSSCSNTTGQTSTTMENKIQTKTATAIAQNVVQPLSTQLRPDSLKSNQISLSNIINDDSNSDNRLFKLPQDNSVTATAAATATATRTGTVTAIPAAATTTSPDKLSSSTTPISRDSPGTRLWNWENWDSDVIW